MIRYILNKAERFFQTDMTYVAKGGFWLSIGKIVSSVSSLLLVLVFGNLVSKTDYGTYQYILSITGILSATALPGMTTALQQAVARGKEGMVKEMIYARIRWGLIGGFISLGFAGYYFLQDNIVLTLGFLIAGIFLPFMDSISIFGSIFSGRKEFRLNSIYGSSLLILRTMGMIAVIFLTQHIGWIILAYFLLNTLSRLALLVILFVFYPPNTEKDPSSISYGKHLSLMNILGAFAVQADKIIMWHLLGPVALATYSFALSPIAQIQSWFKSIETLAFPKLASSDSEVLKKTLPRKIIRLFFFVVPVVVLYITLAPWLYKIFLPQYINSVLYSQALALILLFLPQKLLASAITAKADKKALYIITTATPIVRIAGISIFVFFFGIWGVVIGTLLPYAVNTFMLTYFFLRMKTHS